MYGVEGLKFRVDSSLAHFPGDEGEDDVPEDDAGDGSDAQREEGDAADEEDVLHAVLGPREVLELQSEERYLGDEEEAECQHKEEEEDGTQIGDHLFLA